MEEEKSFGELLDEYSDYVSEEYQEKMELDEYMNRVEEEELEEKTYKKNMDEFKTLVKLERSDKISKRGLERLRNLSKKLRKEKPLDNALCITINDLVRTYLNYCVNAVRWEHSDLKSLQYTYLIGVSNDFARTNQEYVKKGYLLLVLDCKGNLATYINPILLKLYVESVDYGEVVKKLKKIRIHDLREVADYFRQYTDAVEKAEINENFLNFLKESKKDQKVNRIVKNRRHYEIN